MAVLLLLLLWTVIQVEVVHSQAEFPSLHFMNVSLPNHTYVPLSLVSRPEDGGEGVQCRTDLSTCCSSREGSHRGDWYFPNRSRLPFSLTMEDLRYATDNGRPYIYESRRDVLVEIRRMNNASMPNGIYRCDIPTIAVHDVNNISVRETVYAGVYATGGNCSSSVKHFPRVACCVCSVAMFVYIIYMHIYTTCCI